MEDRLLNEAELAKVFGVTTRTVRLWRKGRGLPHVKLSRKKVVFVWSDVAKWIEGMKQ